MRNCFSLLFASLLIVASARAADDPLWMRYPAVSPDGSTIVFSYQGDLYTVPSAGGVAEPLTIHEGYEFRPVWSPDGAQIAFASDRYGDFDVFVMPATGGEATRLTFHSADDLPTDFTPDGKKVLFYAARMDAVTNAQFPIGVLPELYQISVDGGRPEQVLTTPAQDARYDRAGARILYHDRKGFENEFRKHHTSSITRDVWLYDVASGKHTMLTHFEGEDRNPVWSPDEASFYYLSEQSGSFNVWRAPIDAPAQAVQVTHHTRSAVRSLTISDGGDLVYNFLGVIYRLPAGATEPMEVPITLRLADRHNATRFETLRDGATEMALSPNGKEIAFVDRGEVFVTSVEFGTTKRITDTPQQERSVSFSPDGRRLLYAGERDDSWNVYQTKIVRDEEPYFYSSTLLEEEPLLETPAEEFQPAYSPDGKEVAYLEERTTLKVLNLDSGETRTILPAKYNYSYSDGDQWYEWSPDGKWFLVQYLAGPRWVDEVGLVDAAGGADPVNLTQSGYSDGRPRWMMGGKMVLWFSDRRGMRTHGGNGAERDAYGLFLTQEAYDRFNLSKEEYELLKEKKKKEKGDDEEKKDDEGEKKVEPIKIDLANLEERIERLTINSSNLADAVMTPEGDKLVYLSAFEKGHDLWIHDFRENETRLLAKLDARGGSLTLDEKGENAFVLSGGKISKIDLSSGKPKPVSFAAEMDLNAPSERAYLFDHVWRQVKKKFYVKDLQGVDWDYYRSVYAPYVASINNNYDFAEMLSEMLGELNASHTGSGYRHRMEGGDETAALGVFYDRTYDGPGLKIAEVMEKSPLAAADLSIDAGTIIEKIDGVAIAPDTNPFRLLNRKADKATLLSFYDPESGKRWDATVKPISLGQENQLRYQRWVDTRRAEADSLSGGRVGYVHVRSMNDGSFRTTYSEVLGRNADKEALIVDTRFNGGGWLHDDLATLLSGKEYVKMVPRGQQIGSEPQEKWQRPSVVLMSESNYSDAHMFPYAYKALDLGDLVGMPVPGTGTAVWWETLQDPTLYFGIPQVGMVGMDGEYLENHQLMPDYVVDNDPESVARGRDKQLEKAVAVLLAKLDEGPTVETRPKEMEGGK